MIGSGSSAAAACSVGAAKTVASGWVGSAVNGSFSGTTWVARALVGRNAGTFVATSVAVARGAGGVVGAGTGVWFVQEASRMVSRSRENRCIDSLSFALRAASSPRHSSSVSPWRQLSAAPTLSPPAPSPIKGEGEPNVSCCGISPLPLWERGRGRGVKGGVASIALRARNGIIQAVRQGSWILYRLGACMAC